MIYGMYLSAGGAQLQSRRLEVVANNLANVASTGFKRDQFVLRARPAHDVEAGLALPGGAGLDNLGGGVLPYQVHTNFDQASLRPTGKATDVAIVGPGFLRVTDGAREFLTRDGNLVVDEAGFLRTRNHQLQVLGDDGAAIQVDPTLPLEIGSDGSLSQGGASFGRIGLFEPQSYADLRKTGENQFSYRGALLPAPGQVRQGYVEQSGAQPVVELLELIEATRAYEANLNLIQFHDQALGRLITDVPRLQ